MTDDPHNKLQGSQAYAAFPEHRIFKSVLNHCERVSRHKAEPNAWDKIQDVLTVYNACINVDLKLGKRAGPHNMQAAHRTLISMDFADNYEPLNDDSDDAM